ncbi:hypothetical protein GHT06_006279 [Daphnia sinensis]|uniref:Uncharacterized protein n=1 Tax=Daphnia sinensis TaxID=1820382 RepID=A0AAD5PPK6_9CRUS|nr:hypothetical protein GHT06_006279 [Daphnia sinensis]
MLHTVDANYKNLLDSVKLSGIHCCKPLTYVHAILKAKPAIRLKKLQVAAWRDELIRIYEDVKGLHHQYMDSLPDITDPQRQACEKWEVQFDTDHVEILQFAIRYATSSRQSASSIGTTASDVTISTTLSQKRSTRSTSSLGQPSQQDLCIQKQMLELEVKMERARIQMEASNTSATETLSKALKGMGEQLSKLVESAEKTSSEIAANTNLVKDARQSLRAMDEKIKEVNLDLNAQIEGLKTKMEVNQIQLRTIQEQVLDQETRLPKRSQTPAAREDISNRATLKSIEATVMHRRDLSSRGATMSSSVQDPKPRPLPIMPPTCSPCPPLGDDASSDTTPEHPPAAGTSYHSHGGCCSRPRTPSFTIQPRTTLMAIEAKLTPHLKDKWNEKRKRAGAELNVLDLDDWVTVKSMSKQHGKNVFESLPTSTSKSIRFDDKKPVKKSTATHTSTIGHVTTEEGSKATASSSSSPASMGRRPKTEERAPATGGLTTWTAVACLCPSRPRNGLKSCLSPEGVYYASPANMNARSVPGTSNVPWVDALDQDTIPCFTGPNSSH